MSTLKIGMLEQDITPVGPVLLPGQFYKRVSTHVESEIKAEIFVLEADGEQLIIVGMDSTHVTYNLMDLVREKVAAKCADIDTSKIIISATHIHTAPAYFEKCREDEFFGGIQRYFPEDYTFKPATDDDNYMDPKEYLAFLGENISEGIVTAWNKRDTAYIAQEFGRAVVGHSRRVCFNDGTAKMYGIADKATFTEMESGNDTGVELLYVFDKDKKPMGALCNIACPAQVLEHCSFVSSDYWGKAREMVKEEYPDFVLVGLCGAAGCQAPRDMIRFVLPDTLDPNLVRDNEQRPRRTDPDMYAVEGAVEIGDRVSHVVLRKLKSAKNALIGEAVLKHRVEYCELPIRKVTETDRLNALENIRKYIERLPSKEYTAYDTAALHVETGILDRYKMQETVTVIKPEVHFVRLGNIAIATNPFELFLDYGNRIKARSHAEQTFLVQLACECYGYLPTEKAEKGGHYSAYVSSGNCGHEGGDLYVAKTLDAIQEMFDEA